MTSAQEKNDEAAAASAPPLPSSMPFGDVNDPPLRQPSPPPGYNSNQKQSNSMNNANFNHPNGIRIHNLDYLHENYYSTPSVRRTTNI